MRVWFVCWGLGRSLRRQWSCVFSGRPWSRSAVLGPDTTTVNTTTDVLRTANSCKIECFLTSDTWNSWGTSKSKAWHIDGLTDRQTDKVISMWRFLRWRHKLSRAVDSRWQEDYLWKAFCVRSFFLNFSVDTFAHCSCVFNWSWHLNNQETICLRDDVHMIDQIQWGIQIILQHNMLQKVAL